MHTGDPMEEGIAPEEAAADLYRSGRYIEHNPSLWTEFIRRYGEELDSLQAKSAAVAALVAAVRRGRVTLLFGARDHQHNNATALRWYLNRVIG